MSDEPQEVRKVQPPRRKPKGQILSVSRERTAEADAGVRVFGTTTGEDTPSTSTPVGDFDGSIRNELLRLLGLPLSYLDQTPDPNTTSSGAMLARLLLKKAVREETLNAIVQVLDRLEGKATKAAQNKPTNQHITDQLDVSLDSLNDLTKG